MLLRTPSMLSKSFMTAVRAFRPFQAVIWWAGAPLKVYFTPSILRQQVPKPGAGLDVFVLAWLRTMTSMPSNTWFRCIVVLAEGSSSSSAGVPKTVTVPASPALSRNSPMATAAARPIGPCEQCWSP